MCLIFRAGGQREDVQNVAALQKQIFSDMKLTCVTVAAEFTEAHAVITNLYLSVNV